MSGQSSGEGRKGGLGAWLDFRPGHHRPRRVVHGVVSSVLFIGFIYVLFFKPPVLPSGDTTVRAMFRDAPQLRVNQATPVRVAGVDVGKVTKFEPGPGGRGVLVEMAIQPEHGVEVKRDARMTLLYRTILGRNMYVDLEPGSAKAPALAGSVLPADRTTGPVELDQVLYPLDPDGRRSLQRLLAEARRTFSDPEVAGAAIERLSPALDVVGRGVRSLRGERPGDLTRLVRATRRASAALARDDKALGRLIHDGRIALGVTAARRADLQATVSQLPAALAEVRATADRLGTTLDVLDPLAGRLREGARRLPAAARSARSTLAAARPLLADAQPTLRDLEPAAARLGGAAKAGLPVVRGLDPSLTRSISDLVPWLDQRDPELKMKNFQMVGPTVSAAAGAFMNYDANGQVIVFSPGVGTNVVQPSNLPCRARIANISDAKTLGCQQEAMGAVVQGLLGAPSQRLRSLPQRGGRIGVPLTRDRLKGGVR